MTDRPGEHGIEDDVLDVACAYLFLNASGHARLLKPECEPDHRVSCQTAVCKADQLENSIVPLSSLGVLADRQIESNSAKEHPQDYSSCHILLYALF